MSSRSLLIGVAAGAAAVWFLDPNDGARRRDVVRAKAMKYARKSAADVESKARYAAGQAKGAAYDAAPTSEKGHEELGDAALARKVESEIFRAEDAPKGAVAVDVQDGVVDLRGELGDEDAIRRLAEDAANVQGVRGVENLLHTKGTPAPTS